MGFRFLKLKTKKWKKLFPSIPTNKRKDLFTVLAATDNNYEQTIQMLESNFNWNITPEFKDELRSFLE